MESGVAWDSLPAASVATAPTETKLPVTASDGRPNKCSKGDSVKSATSRPSTVIVTEVNPRLSVAVPDTVSPWPRLPAEGPTMEIPGAVLSRRTGTVTDSSLPARSVTVTLTSLSPSVVTTTGSGQVSTPLSSSVHSKVTVISSLFQPSGLGSGDKVAVIVGEIGSSFTATDTVPESAPP